MTEKEFLTNFKEHLKIPFSYRSRKKYRIGNNNIPRLIGRGYKEIVRNYIIENINQGFCPFSWFTSYIHRKTYTWEKQIAYYKQHKFVDISLRAKMIKIVKEYQPVKRKKEENINYGQPDPVIIRTSGGGTCGLM